MKYLLVKALNGFGDRLESLVMCVKFAQDHNLKLLVDWSDPVWEESFYSYFKLDIPTFALSEITKDMTVYPEFWKGQLDRKLTDDINTPDLELNTLKPYDADVIVTKSHGVRTLYPCYKFFAEVFHIIDPRVLNSVKKRQEEYKLKDKYCIHLRGSDRFKNMESKKAKFRQFRSNLIFRGLIPGDCIVITDDPELAKFWKNVEPDTPILSQLLNSGPQGLHYVDPKTLGTTKDQLNVNLLIDLFTMASCKQIFSTSNDSRFARMARRFNPVLSLIL